MTSITSHRRLAAEWEPQSGVLIVWPHDETDWATTLPQVEAVYVDLAGAIALYETVMICGRDQSHVAWIQDQLRAAAIVTKNIRFCIAAYNDTWIRDYGPLCIETQGGVSLIKFMFNGWGARFEAGLDNRLASRLHNQGVFGDVQMEILDDWVLEGGSIETNGRGSLLTTTSCLITANRNSDHDRIEVERQLRRWLGAQHILWLDHGFLAGDDTDGHVDMLVRFCSPATIAHTVCQDPHDEHYAPLQRLAEQLGTFRQPDGSPFRRFPLPLPRPVYGPTGRRLPASYANFLIINGAVIVPAYNDPADSEAQQTLQTCFPDREIVVIHALPLIQQGGSIHCATLQVIDSIPLLSS